MTVPAHRIAMWSPPRARSTMLMRVFEALGCAVLDEPFYAFWLTRMNKTDDPGYSVTVTNHETDWRRVIELVLSPPPGDHSWYYQKHMAIHMLDEVELDWMRAMRNCFLVRHPAAVVVSMSEFRTLTPRSGADVEAAARLVGYPQLRRIYDIACDLEGGVPPVLDADEVLSDPVPLLGRFCNAIGMPFDPRQPITWAPGRHPYDGAWADDWYQKVYATTQLHPAPMKTFQVPPVLQPVVDHCLPIYERIAGHRIR